MAETIRIRSCEDLSWTGKALTCIFLERERSSASCRHIIVDDESYEAHLPIPDNKKVVYITGIHDFANKEAMLI